MKATIGGMFSGSFDFLKANWLVMLGMIIAAAVLLGGLGYLMVGAFFNQALVGATPDPSAIMAMMGQLFLFYLIMLVVFYGISLSIWRHGMTVGQDPVTSNLGWAMLGGLTLTLLYLGLMIAIYIVLALVMLILFAIIGVGVGMSGPAAFSPDALAGPAIVLVIVFYVVVLLASIWFWGRISVIGPVMAEARSVNSVTGLVESWRLTRPSQWTIFGFLIVAAIGSFVVLFVAAIIAGAAQVPWVVFLLYFPLLLFWWAVPPAIHGQIAAPDRSDVFA